MSEIKEPGERKEKNIEELNLNLPFIEHKNGTSTRDIKFSHGWHTVEDGEVIIESSEKKNEPHRVVCYGPCRIRKISPDIIDRENHTEGPSLYEIEK